MYSMTCKNHRGARYLTKNPNTRGLHFVRADEDYVRSLPQNAEIIQRAEADPNFSVAQLLECASMYGAAFECPCPFSDLIFIDDEGNEIPRPEGIDQQYPRW